MEEVAREGGQAREDVPWAGSILAALQPRPELACRGGTGSHVRGVDAWELGWGGGEGLAPRTPVRMLQDSKIPVVPDMLLIRQ